MTIQTKLLRGKYYCYATANGYDYSFEGSTIDEAQTQMRKLLESERLGAYMRNKSVEWEALQVIEDENFTIPAPQINYAKMRIDNNPIG